MPVRNFVNKAIKRSKVFADTKDINLTKKIISNGLKPGTYSFDRQKNSLTLPELDLTIKLKSELFILDGYKNAKELKHTIGATFERNAEGEINLTIAGLKFYIKTAEELYILTEIYCKGTYNLQLNKSAIFIDIGMNVAFTSLYFASLNNIEKVIGFEPLRPTKEQAEKNISLNQSIQQKILVNNYGLSDVDATLEIDYTPTFRGSVGIDGISEHVKNMVGSKEINKEKIELKKASNEIDAICNEYRDQLKILKIDCEGSEYQIIPDLFAAGTLKRINFILMEWHHKGPEPLVQVLNDAGFAIISHDPYSRFGQIYAYNMQHS